MKHDQKKEVIAKFARESGDTGSPEVQIALLTVRIEALTEHLNTHKKDNHSRRGLLGLVQKRRKLKNYLARKNPEALKKISDELEGKKADAKAAKKLEKAEKKGTKVKVSKKKEAASEVTEAKKEKAKKTVAKKAPAKKGKKK